MPTMTNMLDTLVVTLLLTPNVLLAITSKSGRNAGYYVLCGWVAMGIIGGVYTVGFLIYGFAVLVGAAWLFRGRLRMGDWLARKSSFR